MTHDQEQDNSGGQATEGEVARHSQSTNATVAAPYSGYIYAIGTIAPQFPSLSVEKEFRQVAGRAQTKGLTDRQVLAAVLAEPANRYLARQLCYVLTVGGVDVYILQPRDPMDLELLVAAVRPEPSADDVDVVIGVRGPIAFPEACNGLPLPLVRVDQLYSFDVATLINSIPRPESVDAAKFTATAREVFTRLRQVTDNAGGTDQHRALNYLCVRYPTIYTIAAEEFDRDSSLTAVDVRRSPLALQRNLVNVVLTFNNRHTDFVQKYAVTVDVSGAFPFLAAGLRHYLDG